ncbi:TIGR04290 family methyltransferase [Rubrivirga sp. S365]|uniref:TIGR04290 family methyltransferase n=1 Tax=Rubrivirga litoralis TaxID=3075598 RepID=A0ABU3BTJ1_9BACT|nr:MULTISPECIES: TIGR04290 family methyltransferase [unclassified Rubrivirga]MDT0632607.1 TIGR04290 family methyltransferase [Rubrivirga sp. F394]MDT7855429.1 TIGR04290 family methyltransferase [Rubrivirga sp. S365]
MTLDTLQSAGPAAPSTAAERAVAERAPWFHNLHLPDGTQTAPDHPLGDFPAFKWREIAPHVPDDLSGWRVLDIGSNAGFYAFELARRGADVTGLELDPHYIAQAEWAAEQFGLADRVRFRQGTVYDLARMDETFDLVWFMGVFYHLRYPLLALDLVARAAERLVVFQTLTAPGEAAAAPPENLPIDAREQMAQPGWPQMAFIEHRLAGDPTNWWAPNAAACEALLRSAGLRVASRPGHEIWVAERAAEDPNAAARAAELQAVAGDGA